MVNKICLQDSVCFAIGKDLTTLKYKLILWRVLEKVFHIPKAWINQWLTAVVITLLLMKGTTRLVFCD